jgi:predicted aspartyl protease
MMRVVLAFVGFTLAPLPPISVQAQERVAAAEEEIAALRKFIHDCPTRIEVPSDPAAVFDLQVPQNQVRPLAPHQIPMQEHERSYWVYSVINGLLPLELVVDTGAAGELILPYEVVRKLGCLGTIGDADIDGYVTSLTANGKVTSPLVRIKSLRIYGLIYNDVKAEAGRNLDVPVLGTRFISSVDIVNRSIVMFIRPGF